jgi:hypothetical protein
VLSVYQTILEAQGISVINPFIDPVPFSYQTVSHMEKHPNAKTHEHFAYVIANELLTNPTWGFTKHIQNRD